MTKVESVTVRSPGNPATSDPETSQPSTVQLVSVLGLLIPMAGVAAWISAFQSRSPSLEQLFLGPMVGGGLLIFWILYLHLVICSDGTEALGLRRLNILSDLLTSLGLVIVMLAVHFGTVPVLTGLFPRRPPPPQVVALISGVAQNPWLLAVWLGPVVWIGVAVFEELARVFLLRRFWLLWNGPVGRWGGVAAVSALVGLAHIYQGPAAIVSIGIQSLLLGAVYLRSGRLFPLIIAHGLYDSVQVVAAVVAIRHLGV